MEILKGGKGPAVLQLQKWGTSDLQLDLSQFREAFISPTRELLLLLSYHCEALLLPLVKGEAIDNTGTEGPSVYNQNLNSVLSYSPKLGAPGVLDTGGNFSSSHESKRLRSKDDLPYTIDNSGYNNSAFVCDVNSLAWGVSESTYNQSETTSVRELLFVSGNHGVTVHAFRQPSKLSEAIRPAEGDHEKGVWVVWGPTTPLPHYRTALEHSTFHGETFDEVVGVTRANGSAQNLVTLPVKRGNDENSRTVDQKRWLRTLLTKTELFRSGGNTFTRFPEMSSLPPTAKVFSFSIFGNDSQNLNSQSDSRTLSHEGENHKDSDHLRNTTTNLDSSSSSILEGPDFLLKFLTGGMSSSYKCSKVFSSDSHHLIGFVLTSVNRIPINTSDTCEQGGRKVVLIVAKIVSWGIKWVFLVKLPEDVDRWPAVEWTDFRFSDNFLICLNAGGLIYFYVATTGKYVMHLDLLQIHALFPRSKLEESEKFQKSYEAPTTARIEDKRVAISADSNSVRSGLFRRLLVASNSSLLAVIDVHGIVYVICINDYLRGKNHIFEKSLHFQNFGLGPVDGWEVGGVEIGCQRMFSDISQNVLAMKDTRSFKDNIGNNELHEFLECCEIKGGSKSFLSGLPAQTQKMEENLPSTISSHARREIFLPTRRFDEDNIISFSTFGITQLLKQKNKERASQIAHSNLHVVSEIYDDKSSNLNGWEVSLGEAVGCTFQGILYLVTEGGLSVVLPSISLSSNFFPSEDIRHWKSNISTIAASQAGDLFETKGIKLQPWKIEVLDRILLYEAPEVADRICLENGWDLKISRIRRLQLSLDYLKFEEIEMSLEKLVDVNLAEEGILRLLFVAAYLMSQKVSNDNEVSSASRLLVLATCFATKMIRKYGLLHSKNDDVMTWSDSEIESSHLLLISVKKKCNKMSKSKRLWEMGHFLEIIRNLQYRLSSKIKKPAQTVEDSVGALGSVDTYLLQDESVLSTGRASALSVEISNQHEDSLPEFGMDSRIVKKLALMSANTFDVRAHLNSDKIDGSAALASDVYASGRDVLNLENPKDMITRWELDNLDQRNVVQEALLSGRLPLAVLKLHLRRLHDLVGEKEPHDTFSEVRDIGRAIAYDLFLKGETGLAVATLQKLGENIEACLRQLAFGTVRRSLRAQITDEMTKYGYLGLYEGNILERISLIERVYPCSNFWRTFGARQNELFRGLSIKSPEEISLRLVHSMLIITCGEVDGAVLGSWKDVSESPLVPVTDDDSAHSCYWAGAAVWSDVWDQRTVDRIVLDQPFLMGVNMSWESQLEYHICHNDWFGVSELLNVIPAFFHSNGALRISLDGLHANSAAGFNTEFTKYGSYISSIEELDAVCLDVPNIQILRFSAYNMCSLWLRALMDQCLAKRLIFPKEYWEGTESLVSLLAQSGLITSIWEVSSLNDSIEDSSDSNLLDVSGTTLQPGAVQALHKVVIHHCAEYKMPNLLDLYLDHHKLALDNDSLMSFSDAVGDNQWDKWLLFLRVEGHEYDASFCNAHLIASHNSVPGSSVSDFEIEDVIRTVDDIAEGAGEMAALATLMYAPIPIQDCLCSGSVNRHSNSSVQCTLENLRPALQRFPTLWRTFVAACFGQEPTCTFFSPKVKVVGNVGLPDYLNWRDSVFFSSGHDTSLLQILPGWFSKAVRRLIQLYVQGPLGWKSLSGVPRGEFFIFQDAEYRVNTNENGEINALTWEAAIHKHVIEEFYASSSEGSGLGLEHHLHRGRALAAFDQLLSARVQKLKLENIQRWETGNPVGQTNIQTDVHALLSPITLSEESILTSVMPLAVMHFEDSVLVASCAFLLELCGLSVSMLQIDVATLRRISSFYKSSNHSDFSPNGPGYQFVSPEGDITYSLARALADDYLNCDSTATMNKKGSPHNISTKQPSRALVLVQQHLEKASLPLLTDGLTCGSWLLNGNGDGAELRSQQKYASQYWNLVTTFCTIHQIPLSTKYLAVLAQDNDWVGFLLEAQVGGYPFNTVIQVASNEFSNIRLKIHILTVLKGLQSRTKLSSSLNSDIRVGRNTFVEDNVHTPVEVFGIIAECENSKNPGEALLLKAKDLCWSVLAMVASCFPDVSPLSCLTVWLEITAARETSSIKVNDIASQIKDNVGAAVEATNSMPITSRSLAYHYNRTNPKRRRLMEEQTLDPLTSVVTDVTSSTRSEGTIAAQGSIAEDDTVDFLKLSSENDEAVSLSEMVAVLCEQHLFLPLLRAFEMFLPSCSLLPFIRALQAFSQMRLSEAFAHLGSFSARIKEEQSNVPTNNEREWQIGTSWISSTAVKAAAAMLLKCPSPYEKRCLLQLLASTDFCDGGAAAAYFRRHYWKINLAEPSLRKDDCLHLGDETLDDNSLLTALEKNGHWEQARDWARQLEASDGSWKSTVHHVTETQAESMVSEWKEFLWDVPEERVALWAHCQTLFVRYAFPPLQAGSFFLKHAEAAEKDLPARELHELLLLSLQWLSGMITQSHPAYPLHLLREIETRVWLLAVESEAQIKSDGDVSHVSFCNQDPFTGKSSNIIDSTACLIAKMDNHINAMRIKYTEKNDTRETSRTHYRIPQFMDGSTSTISGGTAKAKRRGKAILSSRRLIVDIGDKNIDSEDGYVPLNSKSDIHLQDENLKMDLSFSRWEERVGPAELERAILSLLDFGQITAAKQLQQKLSPGQIPSEFVFVDVALKLAAISTPSSEVSISMLDDEARSVIQSFNLVKDHDMVDPLQVLEKFSANFMEGRGYGLCKRIIAVVKSANSLGIPFSEAFDKQPIELLQLLSLKAQDSFVEASLLVQTHIMPAASIAHILAESFLKGLLAAHRGGYMDSQKEEGPAPLLWRFSDFLKWADLCPSEQEIGHALMRLVITGQEIPHACEVELLILSHHFYKSSACLDGVDVLVALAATRVETYVSEGDFPCLARLITGVGNFHALNFILEILIENGQLDLVLQTYSAAADTNASTAEAVRGFRMAVLTSLKQFNLNDHDAFAMVYNHFDMKHETAALLESRAEQSSQQWFLRYDKDQNEDLLESMRYYIEAAEVHSSIDAGNKTHAACARASLVSLQIRMPDFEWLNLSETHARRALVEQSRFQEAFIFAEAYGLNQPSEWALVLWNQMPKPELTEQFVAEFVAVLPLQPTMLAELARFYRAEVAARGDQSQFSFWLTGGGLPAEWAKYLGRSFRCLLKRTRDLRLRLQLATVATGFGDVINSLLKALDRVPENAAPLVLRKGHGGTYLPLM